ncbi:AAA family ATPase [Alkalibacterium psychrotolerans]
MDKNRGSQFRKWDLHLHSLYSQLNNNYGINTDSDEKNRENLLRKIQESGIEVVGLTNYFKFEEEDFHLKKYLEANGVITFLNLEVRLSNINKNGELFDYHIIFDNNLDQRVIENLQGELKANIGNDEKSFNLLEKNEIENSAHVPFSNLYDVLHKNGDLKDKFLTGFLSRGHGSATSDASKKNMSVYEDICIKSDFIIHSSCNDPENCKDKNCKHNNLSKDREYWLKKSKYTKPLLQSSDAHSFNQIGNKFSWIKADKTFEGFKQILFEPEDRICLDIEKPTLEKDELVIDRIVYEDREIYLSEHLNSIIGGRSTGKSTFLNSIANRLGKKVDENKFMFDEADKFKLFWRDQTEDYKRQIEYIPQEFMFRLAENENSLNNLVNRIIKAKRLDTKIEDYRINCRNLNSEIQKHLDEYFETQEKLLNLQKPEVEEQSTLKRLDSYVEQRQEILGKNNFTEEEKDAFQRLVIDKEKLESETEEAQEQIEELGKLKYQEFHIQFDYDNRLVREIKDDLIDFNEEINRELKNKFNAKIIEWSNLIDQRINTFQVEINNIQDDKVYKMGLEISETNNELLTLDKRIKAENAALDTIKTYKEQRKFIENEISRCQDEIIIKYKSYKNLRESLEKEFEIAENDLEIKLEFKQIDFYDEFAFINGQGNSKAKFIEKLEVDFDSEIETIFMKRDLKYNNNKTESDLINSFFRTHFYDYDFKIIYQNDEFKQMSPIKSI